MTVTPSCLSSRQKTTTIGNAAWTIQTVTWMSLRNGWKSMFLKPQNLPDDCQFLHVLWR